MFTLILNEYGQSSVVVAAEGGAQIAKFIARRKSDVLTLKENLDLVIAKAKEEATQGN